ncbi:MAG: hypothetical protein Q7S32_03260 [bacterium]|nr:hypothetical protein [bacterium]
MGGFKLKEKLLDKSDQGESKGLAWALIVLIMMLMGVAILYFSKNSNYHDTTAATNQPSSRPPRVYSVFYGGGVFSPTNLRIHAGDSVRFQNTSNMPIWVISDPHPAHNDLLGFTSDGDILSRGFFSYTFNTPGIFGYHNERNPNESGVITVR